MLERAHVTDASGNPVELEHLRLPRPDEGEAAGEATGEAAEEQADPAVTEVGSATSIRPIGP